MANAILKLNSHFCIPSLKIEFFSLPGENLRRRREEKEKCCSDTKSPKPPDRPPIRYRRVPESCRPNSDRGNGRVDRGRLRLGELRPNRRVERSAGAPDSMSGWAGTRRAIGRFLCGDPLRQNNNKTKQQNKNKMNPLKWNDKHVTPF